MRSGKVAVMYAVNIAKLVRAEPRVLAGAPGDWRSRGAHLAQLRRSEHLAVEQIQRTDPASDPPPAA